MKPEPLRGASPPTIAGRPKRASLTFSNQNSTFTYPLLDLASAVTSLASTEKAREPLIPPLSSPLLRLELLAQCIGPTRPAPASK